MFGKRSDGARVKGIDPIVQFTPYIMPKRYDAMVQTRQDLDFDGMTRYIRDKRKEGHNVTHMGMIIAAYVRMLCDYPELNRALAEIAEREQVSKAAVAIAWILRHPAKMQAIIGTMNPTHIQDACDAVKVTLSHHDWYALYLASGKFLP